MSDIQTFKDELRQAGQPWSRWGIMIAGAGILALLLAQLPGVPIPFVMLGLAIPAIAVGWVLLIIAFVKRRQWARAHPIEEPVMPDLS
jgi:uncharacterized membrane protein HdeD (DUF308 family)